MLWPSVSQENPDENQPTMTLILLKFFNSWGEGGCTDVEENDILKQMKSDIDIGHQILNENEIVEACIENISIENDGSEDEDDDTEESLGPTHGEGTSMLEKLMTYFERKKLLSSANPTDLQDPTEERRWSSLK